MTSALSKLVLESSGKGFNKFLDVCKEALNMYASLKKNMFIYIRGNSSPFMNRILSKEIMKRSRLRNKLKVKLTRKTTSNKEVIVCLSLGKRKRNTMET